MTSHIHVEMQLHSRQGCYRQYTQQLFLRAGCCFVLLAFRPKYSGVYFTLSAAAVCCALGILVRRDTLDYL